MKKLVVAILAMMLCFAFVGCGSASYTSEGDVTLQNGDGDKCNIQIAEIQKEDDSTTVYIRGTEDFMVSSYTMQSSGFGWKVTVGVKMTDAEGNQVEPVKTTPSSGHPFCRRSKISNSAPSARRVSRTPSRHPRGRTR